MKKIGFIDFYLDEFHAINYPSWIAERAGNSMRVEYAWAEIDKAGGMTNEQFCREKGITLLSTIEEVIEKSDCLIVLSPDNPENHVKYCDHALKSGKPVYVDKTFAVSRADALHMIETAKEYSTPFFSSSALRYAKEYKDVPRENVVFLESRGPGAFDNYAIHQLEPIICFMGPNVEKIMFIGTESTPGFVIKFTDGRSAVFSQHGWECDFSVAVGYADGKSVIVHGATDYFPGFITGMVDFFNTGVPKVDSAETLQIMTILEYGRKAMAQPFEWVEMPC